MKKNSNFFERLMQVAKNKGFKSINDFAINGLKYKASEKLNRLKDSNNNPSVDILLDISNKFEDVDLHWLLTGKKENSNKIYTPFPEQAILKEPQVKYSRDFVYNVFDFDTQAAAGEAIILNDIDKTRTKPNIYLPGIGSGVNIRVPVKGDSMHSTLKDGDKVVGTLVHNPKEDLRSGYVYIIIDKEDGLIIKRLYKDGGNTIEVVSDNDGYTPYKRKLSDFIAIFKAKEVHSSDLRNYYDDVRRDVRDLQKAVLDIQKSLKK